MAFNCVRPHFWNIPTFRRGKFFHTTKLSETACICAFFIYIMMLEENAFAKTHDRLRTARWKRGSSSTIYPYPPGNSLQTSIRPPRVSRLARCSGLTRRTCGGERDCVRRAPRGVERPASARRLNAFASIRRLVRSSSIVVSRAIMNCGDQVGVMARRRSRRVYERITARTHAWLHHGK